MHAVQYDLLGPDKFVELYLLGWINQGFNYAAIPLEMDAYELQNRFEADPTAAFSVPRRGLPQPGVDAGGLIPAWAVLKEFYLERISGKIIS